MRVYENIPLAEYTTYKIGGPAKYFIKCANTDEIQEAISFAENMELPHFVLGGGSNVLVSGKGYNGVVIKVQDAKLEFKNKSVRAGAGADMQRLLDETVKRGLKGLEWAGGLPGTLGGAIRGNAGAFNGEIKNIVRSVTVLTPRGKVITISGPGCDFGYRTSFFKKNPGYIILSAELSFDRGDPEELRRIADEKIEWRNTRHPMEHGNSGSIFKRLSLDDVPEHIHESHPEIVDTVREGQVPTAFFIDECGLKRKRIGGAEVSEKHPNFIVNKDGKAGARDVIMLKSAVKSSVLHDFNVLLEEEIETLGSNQ